MAKKLPIQAALAAAKEEAKKDKKTSAASVKTNSAAAAEIAKKAGAQASALALGAGLHSASTAARAKQALQNTLAAQATATQGVPVRQGSITQMPTAAPDKNHFVTLPGTPQTGSLASNATLLNNTTAGPAPRSSTSMLDADKLYNDTLKKLLADFNAYAGYGPQQKQEIADGLVGGAITNPGKGDINNWDDEAAAHMSSMNAEIMKSMSDAGVFDNPYYALDSKYVGLPSLGYLEGLAEETGKKLEDSLKKDEEDKLYQSDLQSTRGAWEQLEAEKNNPHTFDPMYGYAMMEYLQGDRSAPFNYDQWDYEYQMLTPDQQQARLAELETQWSGLDFDALTGRSYKGYESQTPLLQAQADMLQKEIEVRSIIEALEAGAMNAADFAEMSKYTGDALQMGVNDELMYSDPYFFVNNLFTDDFFDATHNSQINWWNRQIEHSESPYLQMGLANAADYERDVITYYAQTDNIEALNQYIEAKRGKWAERRAETNADFWSALAQNEKTRVLAWLLGRGADVLNYDDKVMQVVATLMGNADPNAAYFDEANMKAAIDAANLEDLGEIEWLNGFKFGGKNIAQHIYSAGTGAVDSGLSLMLDALYGGGGKINQALMAGQAFSSGLQESAERNLSAAHSFAKGGWEAFVGYMSEKMGVGPEGLTSATSYTKDFFGEATEELVGAIGTDVGDEFLAKMFGTTSAFEEEVNALALAGSKDPKRDAIYNRLIKYAEAYGYGGFAGLALGTPGNISQTVDNRTTGKSIQQQGDPEKLVEIAKSMPEGSEARAIAMDIEARVGKGKKPPLGKLGQMAKALDGELNKEYADITNGVMEEAIEQRLVELGTDQEVAKRNAVAIRKMVYGEKLTIKERAAVAWDDNADQVTKEVFGKATEKTEQPQRRETATADLPPGIRDHDLGKNTDKFVDTRGMDKPSTRKAQVVDIEDRLGAIGINQEEAQKLAPIIQKEFRGEELTKEEQAYIEGNEEAEQVVNELNYEQREQQIQVNEENSETLLEIAAGMPEGSTSESIARETQQRIEARDQKTMTFHEFAELATSMISEVTNKGAATIKRMLDQAIENRLIEYGESKFDAKKVARILRKLALGESVSISERLMLNSIGTSKNDILNEFQVETEFKTKEIPRKKEPYYPAWVTEAKRAQIDAAGEVIGKQFRARMASTTKNVSQTVKEAATKGAAKVRKGKDGKPVGKLNARKVYFDDGTSRGEGDILRFEEQEDGLKMIVQTGKTDKETTAVGLNALAEADGAGTAGIIAAVQDINETLHPVSAEEANAMLAGYDTVGGDAAAFVENYEQAYLAGYSGVDTQSVALDPGLAKIAKESGARQAEKDEAKRKQRASAYKAVEDPKTGWLGVVNSRDQLRGLGDEKGLDAAMKTMPESQRVAAQIMLESGKALGLNVVLYDSRGTNTEALPNGAFDEASHTVYYDVSAGAVTAKDVETMKAKGTLGYALMRVGGHELTHYLEVGSPEMYAKYKDAIRKAYAANGTDMSMLIRNQIDKANARGRKMTYAQAVAEVVAEASEYMLQDSKFTNNLDPTLKGKIKEFVQNFAQKIREIFTHLTGGHEESQALMETVNGVKKYMKGLQELWDAGFEEILVKGTTDLPDDATGTVEGRELRNADRDHYDFSKPFDQQVDDWMNGTFPAQDTLLLGRTPEVFKQIGLSDLPLTMDRKHLDFAINGTKNADHHIGVALVKQLPKLLEKPLAIIESQTHPTDSVMAIVDATINGKQAMAAVRIDSNGKINGVPIDSNHMVSVQGRNNAVSKLLYDAVQKENSGKTAVYYVDQKRGVSILKQTGLNISGVLNRGGLIHSIHDVASPVNKQLMEQTDTQQFKRWFGNSQVVNEDGTPKVMYHGTAAEFWTFEKRKANDALGRRMGLGAGKGKFYLSEYEGVGRAAADSAASLGKGNAPRVMELYVSAQKVMDRAEYDRRLEKAYDKYPGSRPNSAGYDYKARDKAVAEVDKAIRKEGYDGVWDRDSGEMFVYEPTQIKSATDNVGTFDPENPDIRYSDRDLPADITVRDYLRELKPTDRMNETEKILLKRYQDTLGKLQEAERNAAEQNEILKTATGDELTKAKSRWQIYRNQANRYARELSRAERNEGFAGLMATGQRLVNQYLTGGYNRIADAQDELETEIRSLGDQLKAIGKTVESAEQGQKTAFARGLFNQNELNAAAKQLKDSYGSRMTIKEISNRLALAYGEIYASDGAEGAKRFADAAKDLAQDIMNSSKYRYRSETLTMISEEIPTISLTETDKQEIKNAGLTVTEYKRGISPFVRVTDGASDLSSYVSNAEAYGGQIVNILGTDTEGDLAMALYNVIQAEKQAEGAGTFEGMTEGESLSAVMVDIMSANLPMTTNSSTLEYLREEMLKYAGESQAAAEAVEGAIQSVKNATKRASTLWHRAVQEVELSEHAIDYYRALEEQRRLMELQEQKKELTEQLKSDAAKKIHEQVEKQRAEYREREQRAREYRKTRDEVDKLRRGIGRKVKRLNALRVRETDQKHVPQELQHVADLVMQTFTDSSLGRLAFSQERLNGLSHRYQMLKELESDATYFWDDEIEMDITNLQALGEAYSALRNREGDVPSRFSLEGVELETEILQGVDAIVSNVMQMIDSANDAFLTQRNETFDQFANQTGEKLLAHDDHKVLKGVFGKIQNMLDETIRTGNVTPIYFFEHLQNQELLDVFNELRIGQNYYAQIVAEGKDFVQAAKEKHNYGKWVADGKLKMKTGQGHVIELNREEAAEIYAIAKREQANKLYQTEHLLYGGFQYKNIQDKVNEDGKTQQTDKPHQLDKADIARIGEWLTAEQKAYADELVGFLSTTMADYGNAASMDMYGYRKFTEQYYIPFHTVAEQRFQRGDEGPQGENAGTGRVKNSGFTKKLQHKANQPLLVGGLTDTVADHIHKMAAYSAMVQPIENMKRLLNHKVLESDGTVNTVRALIGQKYGKASQDYLTQLLKDANGATMSDQRAAALTDKLVGAFKRGAVMASASVVLQQPTAAARAMAYISPKYFAQNPFYRPSKGTWDEMMKYSGTAVIKDMGKFDVGMGLTASQYIADENINMFEAYQRLKADSKTKAGKAAYDRFMAWLTAAPGKADQWTWGLIWKAVKAEQAALHPEMDVNSEAFLQMCGARFDDVVDHTQVYDSVLTRSNLMRSTNALHKMATSFMSEPTLSLNMLYDALTGKHGKKQGARIIGSVVASQVLAGAMAALAQAWNDDDDERNWLEKYADRATGNILSNINVFGMIPYVSDIVSLFEGYDVERPDMSVIADIYDYSKTFFKAFENGGTPSWKQIENFAGTLANLVGVPAKNISREIRRTRNAIWNTDRSTPNGFNVGHAMLENTFWYSEKNADYYQRMVTAHLNGDTELEADFRTYMLTSKMVSEESLANGLQTAMQDRYLDGDVDDDTASKYLLQIGKADDEEDAYWTVDKWQYMKETGNTAQSYRKYDEFFTAVESGANLKATIQTYLDNGVSKSTLATQITNQYKKQLIALKQSGKGYADLQARLLTAYEALGYDRNKKLKDIQKWFEEDKK